MWLLLALLSLARSSHAALSQWETAGDLAASLLTLTNCGLVSAEPPHQWTGGETTLVQLGDMLDRGKEELEVLELLTSSVRRWLLAETIRSSATTRSSTCAAKRPTSFTQGNGGLRAGSFRGVCARSPLARLLAECPSWPSSTTPLCPCRSAGGPRLAFAADARIHRRAQRRCQSVAARRIGKPAEALQPDHHRRLEPRLFVAQRMEPAQHHCQDVQKALGSMACSGGRVSHASGSDQLRVQWRRVALAGDERLCHGGRVRGARDPRRRREGARTRGGRAVHGGRERAENGVSTMTRFN